MHVPARLRILAPALTALAVTAYFLVQSGLAQVIFRGNLEPGSQAFWLSILLAITGLVTVMDHGAQRRPASVEAPRPLALVTPGRQSRSTHHESSRGTQERSKAA